MRSREEAQRMRLERRRSSVERRLERWEKQSPKDKRGKKIQKTQIAYAKSALERLEKRNPK